MNIGLTLTGVDCRTPLEHLCHLVDIGAEIGILFSTHPDDRPRYPSWAVVKRLVRYLGRRCALHVCGGAARTQLYGGGLDSIVNMAGRVQVNGVLTHYYVNDLCKKYPNVQFITQHKAGNAPLMLVEQPNHQILIDASGGEGIKPATWEKLGTSKPVGFAGGLHPRDLYDDLNLIGGVAASGAWVDMESSLRDEDDWFDVGRAYQAVGAWLSWSKRQKS